MLGNFGNLFSPFKKKNKTIYLINLPVTGYEDTL